MWLALGAIIAVVLIAATGLTMTLPASHIVAPLAIVAALVCGNFHQSSRNIIKDRIVAGLECFGLFSAMVNLAQGMKPTQNSHPEPPTCFGVVRNLPAQQTR